VQHEGKEKEAIPEEIIAHIVSKMKAIAETGTGKKVKERDRERIVRERPFIDFLPTTTLFFPSFFPLFLPFFYLFVVRLQKQYLQFPHTSQMNKG
jgi:hypothetical protein